VSSVASDTWSEISPSGITGWGSETDHGSGGVSSGVTSAVTTAASSTAPLWSPDNPLFWFGAIALLVTGAVTLSSTVDVGRLRAKAKV
jgi:hypothetical protein